MKTIAAVALLAAVAVAQDAPPAEEGFRALVRACKAGKAEEIERLLPLVAGKPVTDNDREKTLAWRKEFAAAHEAATPREARERDGVAVVRYKVAGSQDEFELPMRLQEASWVVDAPQGYLVKGKALDRANGRGPAKVQLASRETNDQYRDSAFSFAHVTKDPSQCLNRMDLWYCHNGDLHAVADGRIARVAEDDLESVTGIPVGVAWKKALAPEAGGVYVMHCVRAGHRDFYVRFRTTAVEPRKVQFEWSLLGAGFGSPDGIQSPRPLESKDGPDGFDGLCGSGDARSTPEPKPKEASK